MIETMTLDQHHCCMPHILSQATMLELKVCQLSVAGDTGGFGMTAVVRSQQLHLYRNRKEGATLMLSPQSSNTKVFVENQTDDLGGARCQLVDGGRCKHMRLLT